MKQDYFTLFNTHPSYIQDLNQLKQRWYQLQKQYHPDNFALATPSEREKAEEQAALINAAYKTLITPIKRALYLLNHLGIDIESETDTQMPVGFLMAQMELRERIAEGENVTAEITAAYKACELELMTALNAPVDKEQARFAVRKMLFYEKLNHA